MQQYFADTPLIVGEEYEFNREQAHHAGTVVRLDHERIRLVYDGIGYFAEGYAKGKQFFGKILEQDPEVHEIPCAITVCVALIRREKFELVLQKLTELGVHRIVPFESSRCVIKTGADKKEKRLSRMKAIVLEASEQCKRNRIPEVTETLSFKQLNTVMSDCNIAAYEKAGECAPLIHEVLKPSHQSVTIVIGPEGGFSEAEVEQMCTMGYAPVSLGSRILRAETASMYSMSILAEYFERGQK